MKCAIYNINKLRLVIKNYKMYVLVNPLPHN